MTALADLSHLAGRHDVPGGWGELRGIIEHSIENAPRSLQTRIGPSEIGTTCDRCLIHKLAGTTEQSGPSWLPAIGTAVHAWLGDVFTLHNAGMEHARFLSELTVDVGTIAGQPITGHCDLYDTATATVYDFKIVGKSTRTKARVAPSTVYRTQAHLYGRGMTRRGLPVRDVAILYLPRDAVTLSDTVVFTEPYDEQTAVAALERADRFATWIATFGAQQVIDGAPPHNGDEFSCSRYPDSPAPRGETFADIVAG